MGFKQKTGIFRALPPSSPNVMKYSNFVNFEVSTMLQDLPEPETLKILVVDDHELILSGTIDLLKRQYPQAEIFTAKTTQNALQQVEAFEPDLVIMDLSLPETFGNTAEINRGIKSLGTLMKNYPTLNLVVQSSYVKALVRIKPDIDTHEGGFTVADKGLSSQEMLKRIDLALKGVTHTKDLKMPPGEVKPEWLEVLNLAFEEELEDKVIADRMNLSLRTVRHYWTKVQDVLGVYPEDGKSLRIQTEKRAREEGFID
jgi:DNA-binding NarL/FixJ family response regulator